MKKIALSIARFVLYLLLKYPISLEQPITRFEMLEDSFIMQGFNSDLKLNVVHLCDEVNPMVCYWAKVYIAFHCYDIITYEILVKKSHVADT